jgi:hypothetical protein
VSAAAELVMLASHCGDRFCEWDNATDPESDAVFRSFQNRSTPVVTTGPTNCIPSEVHATILVRSFPYYRFSMFRRLVLRTNTAKNQKIENDNGHRFLVMGPQLAACVLALIRSSVVCTPVQVTIYVTFTTTMGFAWVYHCRWRSTAAQGTNG